MVFEDFVVFATLKDEIIFRNIIWHASETYAVNVS